MKKALICPNQPVCDGWRVAGVEELKYVFEVKAPMEWIGCDDDVVADLFYYDPVTNTIKEIPK
jgi:hypothetical protein